MPDANDSHATSETRENFLRAAIENTQTVIGSVESRVPIALVVHGLIFAGFVDLATHLGPLWHHDAFRIVVSTLLGLTLLFFAVSVLAFIACVSPPSALTPPITGYHPGTVKDLPEGELFFINLRLRRDLLIRLKHVPRCDDPPLHFPDLLEAHEALDAQTIERALSAQLLRISLYRSTKSFWAHAGFFWLKVELGFAIASIATIGVYFLCHPA